MSTAELPMEKKPWEVDVGLDRRFVLYGIDWSQYQAISKALNGRHLRLSYDGENLELMTKSFQHGRFSWLIGRTIGVLTEELGLPLSSCGDMTLDREDLERGIESDEGFYITNEPLVRGKDNIDLRVDPPPDLGIDIDFSRSCRRRLRIYEAIRVPEVWVFDRESIHAFRLNKVGKYIEVERSQYFPHLRLEELTAFLLRANEMKENSLIRSFREWVRDQIAKGWPGKS
jgi:Uma2 family endonuclease